MLIILSTEYLNKDDAELSGIIVPQDNGNDKLVVMFIIIIWLLHGKMPTDLWNCNPRQNDSYKY